MNKKYLTPDEIKTIDFVEKLDGRYRDYCCDELLIVLLIREIPKDDSRDSKYYFAGQAVFEYMLEGKCKAGGNGHHVAQDFQSFMLEEFE